MNLGRILGWALLSCFGTLGCMTPVGAGNLSIPKDARKDCSRQCAELSMELSAVAIMAGNVGCVCQTKDSGQATLGTAPAGMATIALLEEQQRQQQQQQQQQQRR
jgi:hypothetical protein